MVNSNFYKDIKSRWKRFTKHITVFDVVIVVILFLICVSIILPFMNILAISLSSPKEVINNKTMLIPRGFTLSNYYVIGSPWLYKSFFLTVFIVISSTLLHVYLTVLTAFPLAEKNLPGRRYYLIFVLITMLFGGGMIPYFLLIRNLGLIDSVLVFIIPSAIGVYNILLTKNFLLQTPDSLKEAALIDGASYFCILHRIIIPTSKPILATIALFFGVGKWNDWFTAVMFVNKEELYPLQNVLRELIIQGNTDMGGIPNFLRPKFALSISIKMAVIVIATLPIVCVYPFLQKYFVKGIFMGSVKA